MKPTDLSATLAAWGERIPIVGYGSLLSRGSVERSLGPVARFEIVRIPGYARVFDKVCTHSIETEAADPASEEIACCRPIAAPQRVLLGVLFELGRKQTLTLLEREREFTINEVVYERRHDRDRGHALMCMQPRGPDTELRGIVKSLKSGNRLYEGPLLRSDILPARAYLQHCIAAASELGDDVAANFLDESLLADRRTSLREYLASRPEALQRVSVRPSRYTQDPTSLRRTPSSLRHDD